MKKIGGKLNKEGQELLEILYAFVHFLGQRVTERSWHSCSLDGAFGAHSYKCNATRIESLQQRVGSAATVKL